jgi:hypothetical protein
METSLRAARIAVDVGPGLLDASRLVCWMPREDMGA